MDFTYIVALMISVIVGFGIALVFITIKGQNLWKLFISAIIVAVIADFALLINWSHREEITAGFLLRDLAFFVSYGLIGCVVGALPVLGSRWLYRRFKRDQAF